MIVPVLLNAGVDAEISPEFVKSLLSNWNAMDDPEMLPDVIVPVTRVLDAPLGLLHERYASSYVPENGPVLCVCDNVMGAAKVHVTAPFVSALA